MKFIHTSDWHIGQNFYRYDRDDEHRFFFRQLADIVKAQQPDALVVSGDVFHNPIPTAQAQKLFVEGLLAIRDAAPSMAIVVAAGNHDSPSRLEAQGELWLRSNVRVVGGCERGPGGTLIPENFIVHLPGKGTVLAVPYFHPSNFPLTDADADRETRQKDFFEALLTEVAGSDLPVVLTAHLAVDGCDITGHEDMAIGGMVKEKLSELGEGYDYLALGHIHKPQKVGEKAYYSGSPIAVSFSEDYPHYVNLVEIDRKGAEPQVRRIEIAQKRMVKTLPEVPKELDQAIAELSRLSDNDASYIRLSVKCDGPLAPDADERARMAVKGKACRFCEVRVKKKDEILPEISQETLEIKDIANLNPMHIASVSFEKKYQSSMDEETANLLLDIINEVQQRRQ